MELPRDISTDIYQLAESFEANLNSTNLLAELNSDDDALTQWTYSRDCDDFLLIVHEDTIFKTHDDLKDYYDVEHLKFLEEDEILEFISFEMEKNGYDCPAVEFYEISNSVISLIGHPAGQAGIYYSNLAINSDRRDRLEQLAADGFIFNSTTDFSFSKDALIKRFQELVLTRVS